MNAGIYIAIFHLAQRRKIQVGRLGRFEFQGGTYFYVGSAQRNLNARLSRHAKSVKPKRWHVDYLSVRSETLGAIVMDAPKGDECRLAERLGRIYARPVAGFGTGDCGCGGHLFYTDDW